MNDCERWLDAGGCPVRVGDRVCVEGVVVRRVVAANDYWLVVCAGNEEFTVHPNRVRVVVLTTERIAEDLRGIARDLMGDAR